MESNGRRRHLRLLALDLVGFGGQSELELFWFGLVWFGPSCVTFAQTQAAAAYLCLVLFSVSQKLASFVVSGRLKDGQPETTTNTCHDALKADCKILGKTKLSLLNLQIVEIGCKIKKAASAALALAA